MKFEVKVTHLKKIKLYNVREKMSLMRLITKMSQGRIDGLILNAEILFL